MEEIFNPGEEVVHKFDETLDVLTVLRDCGEYVECFEYNPNQAFIISKKKLEKL